MIDLYNQISIISLIVAGIFLVISVILFFTQKISYAIKVVTKSRNYGFTKKKIIKKNIKRGDKNKTFDKTIMEQENSGYQITDLSDANLVNITNESTGTTVLDSGYLGSSEVSGENLDTANLVNGVIPSKGTVVLESNRLGSIQEGGK